MNNRPRKFYGWGYADEALSVAEVEIMERRLAERFGVSHWEVTPPPRPEEFQLPASRIDSVPTRLEPLISTQHLDRLEHSYGQMFVDVARMFERRCPNPPDAVAKPRRERDVADILDWCSAIGAVAIPYGGGTSMVGGIEPPPRAGKVVTIDMRGLDVLLEVDTTSCAAHFQAGVVGADIERSLLEHGKQIA